MRTLAIVLGLAAIVALLLRRRRQDDFVDEKVRARLVLADGAGEQLPQDSPGPRGLGRRDVDAVERAELEHLWRLQ